MDVSGEQASVWTYLEQKYDGDADGRITASEYKRDQKSFERVDRDNDGILTAADFESKGPSRKEMMRGMMAQRMVARYFQVADDADSLALSELESAVDRMDTGGDGQVDAAEFASASKGKKFASEPSPTMRGTDPWKSVLDGVDKDSDGRASKIELVSFFNSRDDGDGVWTLRRRQPGAGRGAGASRPKTGPEVGSQAPDFVLRSLESRSDVALSSFRGKKPVALIFGSYT